MLCWEADLVRRAILGRYKNGPWGYVPFPRSVPHFKGLSEPRGRARGAKYGLNYERLARHLKLVKPLGWPFGRHSLKDLRQHLESHLGDTENARLLSSQADAFVVIFRNNLHKAGPRVADGAKAFLSLWRHIEHRFKNECEACRDNLDERLASKTELD